MQTPLEDCRMPSTSDAQQAMQNYVDAMMLLYAYRPQEQCACLADSLRLNRWLKLLALAQHHHDCIQLIPESVAYTRREATVAISQYPAPGDQAAQITNP